MKNKGGRKSTGGRKSVTIVQNLDFTIGSTCFEERYKVHNQMLCHIIQQVIREETSIQHECIWYKCVKNWTGAIQKGLVVNSEGDFFMHYPGKGTYSKIVSQKG